MSTTARTAFSLEVGVRALRRATLAGMRGRGRGALLRVLLSASLGVSLIGALGCERSSPSGSPAAPPAATPEPAPPAQPPPAQPPPAQPPPAQPPPVATATELLNTRCALCHSVDYLPQQRLTPAQWQKTVDKMVKWGAPLNSDESAVLTSHLAASFGVELPEHQAPLVVPPPGAVTAAAR